MQFLHICNKPLLDITRCSVDEHLSSNVICYAVNVPFHLQSLLSLLRLGPGKEESGYIYLSALSCLRQLCVGLRRRLRFHQDPSFYCAKQGSVPFLLVFK